jgi:hypothetical protein
MPHYKGADMREQDVNPKSNLRKFAALLSLILLVSLAILLITATAQAAEHRAEHDSEAVMQHAFHLEQTLDHYSITDGDAVAQHTAQAETFVAHVDLHFADNHTDDVAHLMMHEHSTEIALAHDELSAVHED